MPAKGHWRWVLASLLGAHFLAHGSTGTMCRAIQQGLLTINNQSNATAANPKLKLHGALLYSGQVCRERTRLVRVRACARRQFGFWNPKNRTNANDTVVPLQATTTCRPSQDCQISANIRAVEVAGCGAALPPGGGVYGGGVGVRR